jgi:hypothetical protein
MLTVIIDARPGDAGLPGLLAQLTAGAVDGVVRQVLIVAPPHRAGIDELCEETGAEAYPTLPAAAKAARAELVMILPSELRLRDGWIGALNAHLAAGGKPALVAGLAGGGFLKPGPVGVLLERARVGDAQDGVDIQGLRRQLGLPRLRLGGQRIG